MAVTEIAAAAARRAAAVSSFFYRHPWAEAGAAAPAGARLAGRPLPRLARGAADVQLLQARGVHRPAGAGVRLHDVRTAVAAGEPRDRLPNGRDGRRRDGRRAPLLAFPVAYYMARYASPRMRCPALPGRDHALVVELPRAGAVAWRAILAGEGVLPWVLGKLQLDGVLRFSLEAPADRRAVARAVQAEPVHRVHVPVAAVHDPAVARLARARAGQACSRRRATWARGRG